MLVGAKAAIADDCGLLGGAINGSGECEIASAVAKTGTYNLDETLHVRGNGRIDASNASLAGITLNICVAPATPSSSCDLILDSPTVTAGGQIEANDIAGNDNASPITIKVSRDVLMRPSSAILAENRVLGGKGGNIGITAGRNMTMNDGAITSAGGYGSAGNSPAGNVTITVGNYPNTPPVGIFTMDPTSRVLANSPGASAGAIAISAGERMDINGVVQSSSGLSGVPNQPPGGGPITLTSACTLTVGDFGKVSSEGQDAGADLVHIEGCDVVINGLVQSLVTQNGGIALPSNPANHCNLDSAAHPFPAGGSDGGYTACVEIWANRVTIDATGSHNGEVSADGVRSNALGPRRAWIDIFAKRDISIIAGTGGNYAVHANAAATTNAFGGLITLKSQQGKIVTTALVPGTKGLAIQANATAGGSKGGDVVIQAGGASPNGAVDLAADSIQAIGASSGGGTQTGGHISVQSFNDGVLGSSPGELNAAGGAPAGTVGLTACVGDPAATYAGSVTGTRTNAGPGVCGGTPSFPTVAHFLTGLAVGDFFTNRQTLWDACLGFATIRGAKFNDLAGDSVKDSGDPGLEGMQIHVLDKATDGATVHEHIATDAGGNFSFTVPPGEYIVCEQGGPPAQTFPAADGSGGVCAAHFGIAGSRGYDVTVVSGQDLGGIDFGNFYGATVSGQKFNDLAGNGVKDPGDSGIEGWEIHLLDKATDGVTVELHTLTDASGNYSFSVPAGEYIVCEEGGGPPEQTVPAADGSGGICAAHTGVAGTRGYDIVLTANQHTTGIDFGNYTPPVTIPGTASGTKFNDVTGNGVRDPGDPGLQGVHIHLFDKATNGATVDLHTLTDASGNFSFTQVPPGEYIVCEQGGPPAQTFPAVDGSGGLCAAHTGVTGSRGYDISVFSNEDTGGNDFGNHGGIPPHPVERIPTLDELGLIGLAALLGAAGAIALRRRRNTASAR
jgi:hypothetical protein